jgi:phosphate starvation-inducible protein PhoH and related proteins
MTEATLTVSTPEELLTLFGTRDQHLRTLRKRFDVSITHRDGQIRVAGPQEEVQRATQTLKRLRGMIQRRGNLTPDDVETVLTEQEERSQSGGGPLGVGPRSDVDIRQAGRRIKPRTEGQALYVEAIRRHDLTFCVGPAGTGKTYLAVALAVEALKSRWVRKIVLVRPAVEAGESLGFLPGDLRAKLNPYLRPLLDALNEMVDFDQARSLMEKDVIEVIPLAYMRGRTLNDAFIILDEAQNTTVAQMKMFLTRMGERSKMVVSGDISQVDLPAGVHSGLRDALERLEGIDAIGVVRLEKTDIVRHRLVQAIVRAYEDQEE